MLEISKLFQLFVLLLQMLQAKAEYEVPVESPNSSDQNPRYVQMSVGQISVSFRGS